MSNESCLESPQWKAFLRDLREEYPSEFSTEEQTLKQVLKDMDQIIDVEKKFLDNPDPDLFEGVEDVDQSSVPTVEGEAL